MEITFGMIYCLGYIITFLVLRYWRHQNRDYKRVDDKNGYGIIFVSAFLSLLSWLAVLVIIIIALGEIKSNPPKWL